MQAVKLPLTSPTDSANRSIKVAEGLQGWSSFITSSQCQDSCCNITGRRNAGTFTSAPSEVRSVRHSVITRLSLEQQVTCQVPNIANIFCHDLNGCQRTESSRPSRRCSVSLSLSTIRFYITFPIFSPSLHNLSFACRAISCSRKISPRDLYTNKRIHIISFSEALREIKMNSEWNSPKVRKKVCSIFNLPLDSFLLFSLIFSNTAL